MTTPSALPSLPGLAWSRHKKPGFSTRVASHVSGREVRVALMSYPLYEFEAIYNGLTSSSTAAFASLGSSSLQSLMGFFLQLLGQVETFLYTDPDDNSVTGQSIGAGDGTTSSFVMGRTLGGFNEPVGWVTNVANVYLNGVSQSASSWAFTAPNSLAFATAPGAGVAITADFTFAFQCRFLDDQMDFEEFMSTLWKLDSMKFRSIKANATPAPVPPPTVTAISPTSGSTSGDTSVTITGTFFGGTTSVTIGGSPATGVTVVNSMTITATTSAGGGGLVNVVVTTPNGIGTGSNLYTYTTWYTAYEIGSTLPSLFADFTTEGGTDHYYYNGSTYVNEAAYATAVGLAETRTSAAEYTNSSGNLASASSGVLRIRDYDPVALTSKGILLEGARTNIQSQSQFASGWTAGPGTTLTANSTTSPDGTSTAALLQAKSGTGGHYLYELNNSATTLSTMSVYAVAGTVGWLGLSFGSNATVDGAFFNLSAGTIGTVTSGATAKIQSIGNGWYRCSVTRTNSSGTYYVQPELHTADNQSVSYNAAGTETIYLWGVQVEAAAFASSYIPTTASSASRAADSFKRTRTNPSAITKLIKATTPPAAPATESTVWSADDGSDNNYIRVVYYSDGHIRVLVEASGTSQANLDMGAVAVNTTFTLALTAAANNFLASLNGGTAVISSSGSMPTGLVNDRIGSGVDAGDEWFSDVMIDAEWTNLVATAAQLEALS